MMMSVTSSGRTPAALTASDGERKFCTFQLSMNFWR
jgi:hypothetical protein